MKGAMKIEFILGVVIFAAIIIYVAAQINTMFLETSVDSKIDSAKLNAMTVLDVLVEDPDAGLVTRSYKTTTDRLNVFSCSNLDKYELGQFKLDVYKEGIETSLLHCGSMSPLPSDIFEVKYITLDDTYGRVILEMW